jgi:hypothetical protein
MVCFSIKLLAQNSYGGGYRKEVPILILSQVHRASFSMGWDYVPELLSLTDILFTTHMIYG